MKPKRLLVYIMLLITLAGLVGCGEAYTSPPEGMQRVSLPPETRRTSTSETWRDSGFSFYLSEAYIYTNEFRNSVNIYCAESGVRTMGIAQIFGNLANNQLANTDYHTAPTDDFPFFATYFSGYFVGFYKGNGQRNGAFWVQILLENEYEWERHSPPMLEALSTLQVYPPTPIWLRNLGIAGIVLVVVGLAVFLFVRRERKIKAWMRSG